jgi:hypothetical protein
VRILLDENLDHAVRKLLVHYDVSTVAYMGWIGQKYGDLLQSADQNGFDVLLTGDRGLGYEQNLTGRRIAVVALTAIQTSLIRQHLPRIVSAIDQAVPGTCQVVDCGRFSRKKRV